MKKLILIALAIAITTGFAVYIFATSLEKRFDVETVPVVVAVTKIPKSTIVEPEMMTVKQLPAEAVNALAVSNPDDIKGRITMESIEANEQILTTRLSDPNQNNNSLSFSIPQNYRALTIKTDDITGVAGYINKGDRVDIVAVMISQIDAAQPVMSQMVAEYVEVLEVGVKTTDSSKNDAEITSITVLVPQQDVLKVNYALSEGKYRLVLRSVVDGTIITPPPYAQ